jgi:hypothetical protein
MGKATFYARLGELAPEINDIRFHYGEGDAETTAVMQMYEVGPYQLGRVLTHGLAFDSDLDNDLVQDSQAI